MIDENIEVHQDRHSNHDYSLEVNLQAGGVGLHGVPINQDTFFQENPGLQNQSVQKSSN